MYCRAENKIMSIGIGQQTNNTMSSWASYLPGQEVRNLADKLHPIENSREDKEAGEGDLEGRRAPEV